MLIHAHIMTLVKLDGSYSWTNDNKSKMSMAIRQFSNGPKEINLQ